MNPTGAAEAIMSAKGFLRDFAILTGGFLFLVILNYIYAPKLESIPNVGFAGIYGQVFAVLALSYISGRLLLIIGSIWIDLVSFALSFLFPPRDGWARTGAWWSNFKRYLKRSDFEINMTTYVLSSEIDSFMGKDPGLGARFEREMHSGILNRLILGILIFLLIGTSMHLFNFYPWFSSILFILLTCYIVFIDDVELMLFLEDLAAFVYRSRTGEWPER